MSLGVDYAAGDAKIRSKYFYTINGNYAIKNNQDVQQNAFKTNQAQTDTFVSSLVGDVGSGNTCTDGKDDGKIGIGGVVANVAQGAVRTIPNMIKGAFTNSEGKFSLAKTALTIGIGAACVAFPAVGLGLCAIGMGAGVIKAGSNVVKALNADTDAEAKAAWEHVGSGATTAALSYVGAKASYNAVEASAGEASVLKGANLLEYAKENGVKQTVVDLAKDCVVSTKNSYGAIKTAFTNASASSKKFNSDYKELSNMEKAKAEALTKQEAGKTLTSEEKAAIDAWENLDASKYDPKALEKLSQDNTSNFLKSEVKVARASGDKAAIKTAKANLSDFNKENSAVYNFFKTTKSQLSEKASSVKPTDIKSLRAKLSPSSLLKSIKSMAAKDAQIAKALLDKSISDQTIISQFGYDKVGQVLAVLAGENSTDNIL